MACSTKRLIASGRVRGLTQATGANLWLFFPLRLFSIRGLSLASLILFEVFRLFLFCWWLFFHRTLHETLKSSRGLDQGEAGLGVLDLAQMHRTLRHDHFEGRPHARFAEMSSFGAAIAGSDHDLYMQCGAPDSRWIALAPVRNPRNDSWLPVGPELVWRLCVRATKRGYNSAGAKNRKAFLKCPKS
jgi:hypothetical protein